MNKETHAAVGACIGGLTYLAVCKFVNEEPTIGGILGSVGLGAGMALFHDVLEPAVNPNHRAFFHSFAFNGMIALSMKSAWSNENLENDEKIFLLTIGTAFLSHPILDMTTPKGLPII